MFEHELNTTLRAIEADQAIRELELPTFLGVRVNGDIHYALFSSQPELAELTLAENAVFDFEQNGRSADDLILRLYDHTTLRLDHRFIDFVRGIDGRLNPIKTIEFGNILRIDYVDEVGDVVVREENNYVYQVPGVINSLVLSRTKTLTWFRRDGTAHPINKIVPKTYNLDQALAAAAKRRSLTISQLETEIFGYLFFGVFGGDPVQTAEAARSFRNLSLMEVNEYLASGETSHLIETFQNDTVHTWLDTPIDPETGATIRQIAISRII